MNSTLVSLLVLACILGGAFLGMWLRSALPAHHVDEEFKDIVKLTMGLIATMTALVLGLVIASAKSVLDDADTAVKQSSANVLMLDRALARYGPETADIRKSVQRAVAGRIELTWPEEESRAAKLEDPGTTPVVEQIEDRIRALAPGSEAQRSLQSQALQYTNTLLETRWLVFDRAASPFPIRFLGILVFWLTLIFTSFGLFAPRHATSIGLLSLSALSVAAAIFLILEMHRPFDGFIKVSAEPLRYALAHLGQ